MKIAYISDQVLPQTATDTEQTLNMVSAFAGQGAQVVLVVPYLVGTPRPTPEGLAEYYEVAPNFEVAAAPLLTRPRGLAKVLHAARSTLGRIARDSDVIYTRNLPTVVAASLRPRTPVVYETYRPWPDQHRAVRRVLAQLAQSHAAAGLVLHSELAAASFAKVGFAREQLLVAHNAWDPKRLEPRLEPAQARAQCNLPASGPIVTYAGRIAPHKGLGRVLDLARALRDVHFVLVGSEGHGPIEIEAAPMPNVTVRPWLPFRDVVPYLYASDVLLIPPTLSPLQEAGTTVLPMKTFLYMATGRPIFAGDGPDIGEVLTDGHNACLVAADDPGAATDRLRQLLGDAELQARLGGAAQQQMQAWTWEHRAGRVLEFVERKCAQSFSASTA